jgi:hypothetical protein
MSIEKIPRIPVTLKPIAWGKRDRNLAEAVCMHLADATPPIVIPANPLKHARIKRCLHHLGVIA